MTMPSTENPAPRPLLVAMHLTARGGFIVTSDGAKIYLTDEPEMWALMHDRVDPRLNVVPEGNC